MRTRHSKVMRNGLYQKVAAIRKRCASSGASNFSHSYKE